LHFQKGASIMPGRGPQTFKKRQKEQQRKEKQEEKMARRLARKNAPPGSEDADTENSAETDSGDAAVAGGDSKDQADAAGGFAA
jgi:hypothetical protein